jgi:hypothetical protein
MTGIRSWILRQKGRPRAVRISGAILFAGGAAVLGLAAASQDHAPEPGAGAAGTIGPSGGRTSTTPGTGTGGAHPQAGSGGGPGASGPVLPASMPVSLSIRAISVQSPLQALGLNADGSLEVPGPGPFYNEAAWYKYSPTPGQLGPSIIEGHIDSAAEGPSVFFRLGALRPGDEIDVTRADHTVAVFTVSGVRQFPKAAFPTAIVYGNTSFAALRLITCGGSFDRSVGSYVANTVVFASLSSSHPATGRI